MILTSAEIEDGATLRTDVCIVGTGPAGMSLAFELSRGGRDVLLLESGGRKASPEATDLARGDVVGQALPGLEACRSRYLGGSSNCWAGFCRPLSAEDFEARPWVPWSGWPIGLDELQAHYDQAAAFLGVAGGTWEAAPWAEAGHGPWDLGPDLRSGVFQLSQPVRLAVRDVDALEQQERLQVVLDATLTRIGLDQSGRQVEVLDVARTTGGGGFAVAPQVTVLATGGLENARMLLASRDVQPDGVGNDRDLVGRFFMEHPHVNDEAVLLAGGGNAGVRFYVPRVTSGQKVWAWFGLTPEARAREQILDFSVVIRQSRPGDAGAWAGPLEGALRAFGGTPDAEVGCTFGLGTPAESAPNPDSRVLLSDELDALGVPRIALDWRLTELDKRTLARGYELVARGVAHAGAGRVRILLPDGPDFPEGTGGGCHHMGTTRMATDPAEGVVDENLQVHGVAGLYVAGSSVFCTSGAPNPTLTLTALSFRLAAHLLQDAS